MLKSIFFVLALLPMTAIAAKRSANVRAKQDHVQSELTRKLNSVSQILKLKVRCDYDVSDSQCLQGLNTLAEYNQDISGLGFSEIIVSKSTREYSDDLYIPYNSDVKTVVSYINPKVARSLPEIKKFYSPRLRCAISVPSIKECQSYLKTLASIIDQKPDIKDTDIKMIYISKTEAQAFMSYEMTITPDMFNGDTLLAVAEKSGNQISKAKDDEETVANILGVSKVECAQNLSVSKCQNALQAAMNLKGLLNNTSLKKIVFGLEDKFDIKFRELDINAQNLPSQLSTLISSSAKKMDQEDRAQMIAKMKENTNGLQLVKYVGQSNIRAPNKMPMACEIYVGFDGNSQIHYVSYRTNTDISMKLLSGLFMTGISVLGHDIRRDKDAMYNEMKRGSEFMEVPLLSDKKVAEIQSQPNYNDVGEIKVKRTTDAFEVYMDIKGDSSVKMKMSFDKNRNIKHFENAMTASQMGIGGTLSSECSNLAPAQEI